MVDAARARASGHASLTLGLRSDWPAVSYRLAVESFDARLIWDGEMAGEVGDG
jgi:hypothetical protein